MMRQGDGKRRQTRGLVLPGKDTLARLAEKGRELGTMVTVAYLEELAAKANALDADGNIDIVALAAYIEAKVLPK